VRVVGPVGLEGPGRECVEDEDAARRERVPNAPEHATQRDFAGHVVQHVVAGDRERVHGREPEIREVPCPQLHTVVGAAALARTSQHGSRPVDTEHVHAGGCDARGEQP
jgi:hypothetical protein